MTEDLEDYDPDLINKLIENEGAPLVAFKNEGFAILRRVAEMAKKERLCNIHERKPVAGAGPELLLSLAEEADEDGDSHLALDLRGLASAIERYERVRAMDSEMRDLIIERLGLSGPDELKEVTGSPRAADLVNVLLYHIERFEEALGEEASV